MVVKKTTGEFMLKLNGMKRWTMLVMLAGCGQMEGNDEEVDQLQQSVWATLTYDPNCAVAYALKNYNDRTGPAPFASSASDGGNCANFANQSVRAGFVCSDSSRTVFDRGPDFSSDRYVKKTFKWYNEGGGVQGNAWSSTSYLRKYAVQSETTSCTGLIFDFVTMSTGTTPLNEYAVQVGDIVFGDWENDWQAIETTWDARGFNHTMIVSEIDYGASGLERIKVASQTEYVAKKTLKQWKTEYPKAVFHIHRPRYFLPYTLVSCPAS